MLRAETLTRAEVVGFLNERFVIAWSNLLPELYGNADPLASPPPRYNPDHVRSMPEGSGGGNIRAYFCNSQGEIVHLVMGYWKPERFMEEVRFALELLESDPGLVREQQSRRKALWKEQQQKLLAHLPEKPGPNDPASIRVAQCGVCVRAQDDLLPDLFADIEKVLERRREDVYLKGAVG